MIRDHTRERWIEPLAATDDFVESFKAIIAASSEQLDQNDVCLGCPLNNLSQEMANVDAKFREVIASVFNEWIAGVEAAICRSQEAGKMRRDIDANHMALFIVASLEGCMGLAKSEQSIERLRASVQPLVLFLTSLKG